MTRTYLLSMNIKAVAKYANVSTATVSRTINGSAKVDPGTAERVRQAIKATGFYLDSNARSLGSGRSNLFGLIISDITNPFFPELVKSFEDIAVKHGRDVLIANTNYDPERIKLCVTRMLQRKVDGVAIMTSEMDEGLIEIFNRKQIPLVFLDGGTLNHGLSSVSINYSAGVEMAVSHLLELGHQSIAFISGPMQLTSARTRYTAFMESSAAGHLKTHPAMIQEGNHRVDGGYQAMQRILEAGEKPTAVLVSNDLSAIGAIGAIFDYGLRVPDDISVIGFDDIDLGAYTNPPLTTVHLPLPEIAEAAFNALLNARPDGKGHLQMGILRIVSPTFVIRKSTSRVHVWSTQKPSSK